jgi:predicted O-methyltransferase YrrM
MKNDDSGVDVPVLPLEVREVIHRILSEVPIDFGGGCSEAKADRIAELIIGSGATTAVDIGVYRGRSFLPMAAALQWLGSGTAYGIDPYSAAAAHQTDDHEVGDILVPWADEQDWDAIGAQVQAQIDHKALSPFAQLVRETSRDAASRFAARSLDLIHIDGNHDRAAVELDYELYRPRVRPGEFIVLDDISWASVQSVYDDLLGTSTFVEEARGDGDDFAIFSLPG